MTKILASSFILLFAAAPFAQSATEAQVLAWLKSPNEQVRHAAVLHVRKRMPAAQRSEQLDKALADELVRLNGVRSERRLRRIAGAAPSGNFNFDYFSDVADVVAESRRELVIPALAGALGTGRAVQEALARFQVRALGRVLAAARLTAGDTAGTVSPSVVADALDTLRLIKTQSPALSLADHQAIVAVAGERLQGKQQPQVVLAAIELAIATGDSVLSAKVKALDNRANVVSLGVQDDRWITMIQQASQRAQKQRR